MNLIQFKRQFRKLTKLKPQNHLKFSLEDVAAQVIEITHKVPILRGTDPSQTTTLISFSRIITKEQMKEDIITVVVSEEIITTEGGITIIIKTYPTTGLAVITTCFTLKRKTAQSPSN